MNSHKSIIQSSLLKDQDYHFLYTLYQMRTLDTRQVQRYFYPEYKRHDAFLAEVLWRLEGMDLISVNNYKNGKHVSIETGGINLIRDEFDLPINEFDFDKNVIRRGYYRASDLRISPRLAAHEIGLNEFVLQFKERADKSLSWKYYSEKYVSQFTGIRPDAMIRTLNVDIFLEQDMNTESQSQLDDKWNNYQTHLSNRAYELSDRNIMVFFIIDNIKRKETIQKRKDVVMYTATQSLIDKLGNNFDIIVGTRDELLDYMFNIYLPTLQLTNQKHNQFIEVMRNKHDFVVRDATKISNLVGTEYDFLAYQLDDEGKLKVENKQIQEFLVDDATFFPLSMMSKIDYYKKQNAIFRQNLKRNVSMIFLVGDNEEDELRKNLKITGLLARDNIYFTTLQRLRKYPFEKALFAFDSLGQKYHFMNKGLVARVVEE